MSFSPARTAPARGPRLALAVLLLGALLLVVVGVRLFVAGVASYQAQTFIDDWQSSTTAPTARAWAVAKGAADRALAFYPGRNGDYYDRLGQVDEWHVVNSAYGDPEARSAREAALEAYRLAVRVRPDWPYSWVQLASVKLRMQEFDDEFDEALRRSFENGPWRIDINRRLAEIGLVAWPRLDQTQRLQILESARRTVEYSDGTARGLFAMAGDIGQADRLCRALSPVLQIERGICIPSAE